MLSKEAQERLLKLAKVPDNEIAELLGEEEKDFTPSALKVYTDEEWQTVEANMKAANNKASIAAGKDIAMKELKKIAGLPEDAPKDANAILEAYKASVLEDAKIPANEAKTRLEQEKQQLQQRITALEQEKQTIAAEKQTLARDTEWLKKFPANRNEMSDEDRLLLLKNKLQVIEEDGKIAYSYKGQRLQDSTLNDFDLDKAMAHVFESEKWIKTDGNPIKGRGAGNDNNGNGLKPMKASEAAQQWAAQGKGEPMGAEYQSYLGGLVKENPQFDLNG